MILQTGFASRNEKLMGAAMREFASSTVQSLTKANFGLWVSQIRPVTAKDVEAKVCLFFETRLAQRKVLWRVTSNGKQFQQNDDNPHARVLTTRLSCGLETPS
jgi:hypothetical protein